jgi:hypothetical protein
VGDIPTGLTIDHTCHTKDCDEGVICSHRRCVNPDHLEPVTHQVNLLRGRGIPAINAAKTHCIRGHEYTPDNTAVYLNERGTPYRACRQCERERQREPHVVIHIRR